MANTIAYGRLGVYGPLIRTAWGQSPATDQPAKSWWEEDQTAQPVAEPQPPPSGPPPSNEQEAAIKADHDQMYQDISNLWERLSIALDRQDMVLADNLARQLNNKIEVLRDKLARVPQQNQSAQDYTKKLLEASGLDTIVPTGQTSVAATQAIVDTHATLQEATRKTYQPNGVSPVPPVVDFREKSRQSAQIRDAAVQQRRSAAQVAQDRKREQATQRALEIQAAREERRRLAKEAQDARRAERAARGVIAAEERQEKEQAKLDLRRKTLYTDNFTVEEQRVATDGKDDAFERAEQMRRQRLLNSFKEQKAYCMKKYEEEFSRNRVTRETMRCLEYADSQIELQEQAITDSKARQNAIHERIKWRKDQMDAMRRKEKWGRNHTAEPNAPAARSHQERIAEARNRVRKAQQQVEEAEKEMSELGNNAQRSKTKEATNSFNAAATKHDEAKTELNAAQAELANVSKTEAIAIESKEQRRKKLDEAMSQQQGKEATATTRSSRDEEMLAKGNRIRQALAAQRRRRQGPVPQTFLFPPTGTASAARLREIQRLGSPTSRGLYYR